jgi:hypothetical protein
LGVPFREGCRRWAELSSNRFVDVLMGGVSVKSAFVYNQLLFAIGSSLLGYGSARTENEEEWMGILMAIIASLVTFALFEVWSAPILTMSDTVLMGFGEAREKLRSSAAPLYNLLTESYRAGLAERLATK